jgi:hypothetical protein
MMPADISFTNLFAVFLAWLKGAIHPVLTLNKFLKYNQTASTPLPPDLVKYISVSVLISFMVEIPIHQLYGITWTNAGYYISNFLIEVSYLILPATTIHLVLRLRGVKSDFWRTFILFSSPAVAYLPLTNLLNLESLNASLAALLEAKKLHLDAVSAIQYLFKNAQRLQTAKLGSEPISQAVLAVSSVLSTFTQTLTAEGVRQYYRIDRLVAYTAIVTSSLLVIVAEFVLTSFLGFLANYAFISAS